MMKTFIECRRCKKYLHDIDSYQCDYCNNYDKYVKKKCNQTLTDNEWNNVNLQDFYLQNLIIKDKEFHWKVIKYINNEMSLLVSKYRKTDRFGLIGKTKPRIIKLFPKNYMALIERYPQYIRYFKDSLYYFRAIKKIPTTKYFNINNSYNMQKFIFKYATYNSKIDMIKKNYVCPDYINSLEFKEKWGYLKFINQLNICSDI